MGMDLRVRGDRRECLSGSAAGLVFMGAEWRSLGRLVLEYMGSHCVRDG